tara:strand:+ start:317 stop:892 length:576 start_codon:yes stop_codon:yes gene_type:complete
MSVGIDFPAFVEHLLGVVQKKGSSGINLLQLRRTMPTAHICVEDIDVALEMLMKRNDIIVVRNSHHMTSSMWIIDAHVWNADTTNVRMASWTEVLDRLAIKAGKEMSVDLKVSDRVMAILKRGPASATKIKLAFPGTSTRIVTGVLDQMLEKGWITKTIIAGNTKPTTVYERAPLKNDADRAALAALRGQG